MGRMSLRKFMFHSGPLVRGAFGQTRGMYAQPCKVGRHVSTVRPLRVPPKIQVNQLIFSLLRSCQVVRDARQVSTDFPAYIRRW